MRFLTGGMATLLGGHVASLRAKPAIRLGGPPSQP
jgi:hypothetical protein